MEALTSEQLYELTDRINAAFNEFERDGVPVFRTLMPGQVRLILAQVDAWRAKLDAPSTPNPSWKRGYEEGYADAERAYLFPTGQALREEAEDKRDPFHGFYAAPPQLSPASDDLPHGYYVAGNGTPAPDPATPRLSPEAQTPLVPRRPKAPSGLPMVREEMDT